MSLPFEDSNLNFFAGTHSDSASLGTHTALHETYPTVLNQLPTPPLPYQPWQPTGPSSFPMSSNAVVGAHPAAPVPALTPANLHRLDLSSTVVHNNGSASTSALTGPGRLFQTLLSDGPQAALQPDQMMRPGHDSWVPRPRSPPDSQLRLPAPLANSRSTAIDGRTAEQYPTAGPSAPLLAGAVGLGPAFKSPQWAALSGPAGHTSAAQEPSELWAQIHGLVDTSAALQRQIRGVVAAVQRKQHSAAWLREHRYSWIEDVSVLERAVNGEARPEDLAWFLDTDGRPSGFTRPILPSKSRDACRHFGKAFARFETEFMSAWREYEVIVRYGGKFDEDVVRRAFGARWQAYRRMKSLGWTSAGILREHYRWQTSNGLFDDASGDFDSDAEGETDDGQVSETK